MKCPNCGIELNIKVEKGIAAQKPFERQNVTIDDCKAALGDLAPLMDYSVNGKGVIVVKRKEWLLSEFRECNERLKEIGAKWIPEGKDSRWEV